MAPHDRPETGPVPPGPDPDAGRYQPGRSRGRWPWAVAAAVAAALGAWAVSETKLVRVAPARERFVAMGTPLTNPTPKTRAVAAVATATRSYAVLGGALGLALGLAGGLARRSPLGAALAATAGLVVGAVAAGGAATLGLPVYERVRYDLSGDLVALLLHGWIWAWAGASSGLALGLGLWGRPGLVLRAILGGALGAVIGAGAHEVLASLLFPAAEAGPIPATPSARLFALVLPSVATAMIAALAARPGVGPRAVVPEESGSGAS